MNAVEFTLSHYGNHYFLYSPVELAPRRGLEFVKMYTEADMMTARVGWRMYKATVKAFDAIRATHDTRDLD